MFGTGFILPPRRRNGEPSKAQSAAAPFELAKLPGDLLQELASRLTLYDLCQLLRTGDTSLTRMLAQYIHTGRALRHSCQTRNLPSFYFPIASTLSSLKQLELSKLLPSEPWARILIQHAPPGLERLWIKFNMAFVEFFEQEQAAPGNPLTDAPLAPSQARYLAQYPNRASVEDFFAHFPRLTSLRMHSHSRERTNTPRMLMGSFCSSLPRSLTELACNERRSERHTLDPNAVKHLPRGLFSLKIPNLPLTRSGIAHLPPHLTELDCLIAEAVEGEQIGNALPPNLTDLTLAMSYRPTSAFWTSLATTLPLQTLTISSKFDILPTQLPPNLTALISQYHAFNEELSTTMPRGLRRLATAYNFMDVAIARTLPPSLQVLQGLVLKEGSSGAVIAVLPRTIRVLQVNSIDSEGVAALPPQLTELRAPTTFFEPVSLLPRSLLSLETSAPSYSRNALLQLPPKLTYLDLGVWAPIDADMGDVFPQTLRKLQFSSVSIRLPPAPSTTPTSPELDGKWLIPDPEKEPERTALEISLCEERIVRFLACLPDGLHCRFGFTCNGYRLKTSPYLHTLRPDCYTKDASHRIEGFRLHAEGAAFSRSPINFYVCF